MKTFTTKVASSGDRNVIVVPLTDKTDFEPGTPVWVGRIDMSPEHQKSLKQAILAHNLAKSDDIPQKTGEKVSKG